jgi:hypothetical protein
MKIQLQSIGVMLAIIGFFAMLVFSVGTLYWWKDDNVASPEPVKPKIFSQLIAEGLRYRDSQNMGIDRFAFKSCRIEKRRKGAITFGAFNVLVVDGLVLNLPAEASIPVNSEPVGGSSFSWMKGDGLDETLLRSQGERLGMGVGRVSGIRINGLTVNRCDDTNGVSFVFSAALAESGTGKEELRLQECAVRKPDGSKVRVNKARLILKPDPKLVYVKDGVEQSVGL